MTKKWPVHQFRDVTVWDSRFDDVTLSADCRCYSNFLRKTLTTFKNLVPDWRHFRLNKLNIFLRVLTPYTVSMKWKWTNHVNIDAGWLHSSANPHVDGSAIQDRDGDFRVELDDSSGGERGTDKCHATNRHNSRYRRQTQTVEWTRIEHLGDNPHFTK